MAAGRPVISWEIPDRPRNKTLFEDGKEIVLFDKSNPQQLANHIRHIQNNPDFARHLATSALTKVRKFHTIENRVRQILSWIDTDTEPVFGDVHKNIELKQHMQEALLVPASTYKVEEQRQHRYEPALRRCGEQRNLPTKTYFIKKEYQCNLDTKGNANPYFDDVDSSSSFQADVYRFAADVIRKYRLKSVLDIGCGFGIKLSQYIYPLCNDITGIDVEHAIEFCKRKHNFGKWFIDDIEKPSLHLDRQFDLIIAADVIEHLANPDALLEYIKSYCHSNTFIILSTPERDVIRGKDSSGPPLNETHVREWNMSEFHKYICSYGLNVLKSSMAKDKDVSLVKSCQVLLCKSGIGLQQSRRGKTDLKRQTVPVGELPAVSVVIPCYNQAEFLPEAVQSIVNQTFRDWECIIVDDGSTDETSEVADSLIAKYADKRIRLLEKENGGLADARNTGIMAATADWILLLDSDDIYGPQFLEGAFNIIHADSSVNVVFANPQKFGAKSGEWVPEDYTPQKILSYNTIVGTSLFKRQLWEKVGGYNPSIPWGAEDWDFWISCSKLGLVVKRVEGRHFFYRIHEKGSMYTDVVEHSDEVRAAIRTAHPDLYGFQQLLNDHKLISSMHPDTFEVINKKIDRFPHLPLLYFWRALKYERDGSFDEAVRDYNKAIQYGTAEDWQSFLRLGLLQGRKGDIQRAQHNIKRVLSIRPDFRWAQDILVKLQPKTSSRSEKLKILFYYDGLSNFDKNLGGTVIAVLSFAKMLLHSRHDIVIHLTGAHVQHRRQYESFQVIPLPQEDKRDEFIADYDVVFFVTHFRYFKGMAKPPEQIWVLYQHCWDMAGGALARMNDFDVVLCLSEAHTNELRRYGVPARKQIIVPNLVDTDLYCPQDVERKGHSIMYAGAIHEHKGVHILLDAFRSVRQIIRDIELHIYGSRSMWAGTDDYEKRIKAAKTEGVYFHGYIDSKDMPQIYSKHSILCLPSKLESFGLVTVEAQACGCIPVVHNAGGAAATLLDGRTGFLYSPNTFQSCGIDLPLPEKSMQLRHCLKVRILSRPVSNVGACYESIRSIRICCC
jgi:glycosyltransferase involved in cell wall biosynthesis/SAM-dependent methyltransferase